MQRLTKYSLLLKAVLKKTDDVNQKKDLAEMVRHFRRQRIYLLTGSDEGRFAKFSKSQLKAPTSAFTFKTAGAFNHEKALIGAFSVIL